MEKLGGKPRVAESPRWIHGRALFHQTCDADAKVVVTEDPRGAVRGADAVYTDVWLSMGEPEALRAERTDQLTPYRMTPAQLALATPDAIFMHCLPAHRGEEVDAACRFVEGGGRQAGIGNLGEAADFLAGPAGTMIRMR